MRGRCHWLTVKGMTAEHIRRLMSSRCDFRLQQFARLVRPHYGFFPFNRRRFLKSSKRCSSVSKTVHRRALCSAGRSAQRRVVCCTRASSRTGWRSSRGSYNVTQVFNNSKLFAVRCVFINFVQFVCVL